MKIIVDEVDFENDKNICIRFSGEDIKFIVTEYSVAVYINNEIADSLQFHLGSILQDRERKISLDK